MLFVIAPILILLLVFGPHLWIRHVMKKHGAPDSAMPGTGGELAQHLINRFELSDVIVEPTDEGDHYAPSDKAVRLSRDVFDGRSVTAVAVAAHEVGHAIQYHRQEAITGLRHRYSPVAIMIQKVAVGFLIAIPLVVALFKVPHVALLTALIGVVAMVASVLVQFIILPMEWDASFNKAMPILVKGGYLQNHQFDAANSVLKAAAFTYVAAALLDILRLGRWLMILRSAIR
ncbi:zinc metallopeptidase [Marinobacter arenosus]|uniref:zinc metallopeptidase n=1 Tax=Marinobacter arenosus TaxID=2856822 RepID=UPI001C4AE0C2|nr:zinc metallopeptidase [Marinobacter arenosus]MBW0148030.1 zinc metallopeptidase [Marinobacter arenosus]